MLEGITVGFILSLTLFPGTVWLIKVGIGGTKGQVLAVGPLFLVIRVFRQAGACADHAALAQ
jgi:hypothetical protein